MPIREVMQMRREIALKMKIEGKTYLEIGKALGISTRSAAYLLAPTEAERKEIEGRTNGACAMCGRKSRKMIAHHDDYKTGSIRLLCIPCHSVVHGEMHLPRNHNSGQPVMDMTVNISRISIVLPDDIIDWLYSTCKDKETISGKVFDILDNTRQLQGKLSGAKL